MTEAPAWSAGPTCQITRVLKINQLETLTDDVIGAAASILVIGKCDNERSQNTATSHSPLTHGKHRTQSSHESHSADGR